MAYSQHGSVSGGVSTKTTRRKTLGVYTVTKEITCDVGSVGSLTPSLGSTISDGGKTYFLTESGDETLPGSLSKITLVYSAQGTEDDELPATSYNESVSTMEVDIKLHPDFSDWEDDFDSEKEAFKPGTPKYGITSYLVRTRTVTKSEYFSGDPGGDEADGCTIESPGGGFGGSGKWLNLGSSRSKQGDIWIRETTYLYSGKGWDSEIYP